MMGGRVDSFWGSYDKETNTRYSTETITSRFKWLLKIKIKAYLEDISEELCKLLQTKVPTEEEYICVLDFQNKAVDIQKTDIQ